VGDKATDSPLYRQGTVLITGGSGFIGTHLVSAMVSAGARVINFDTRAPSKPEQNSVWVQGDLTDQDQVNALIARERPVLIYNLAAHARLDGTAADMRVNVIGVKNLISALETLEIDGLLIQASTIAVAGANTDNFDPTKFEPQYGLYAESKVEAEKLLLSAPKRIRWTIVRPSVIWGPYHPVLPYQIWRYIRLGLYMHPSGFDVIRSYGYVENVVQQLMAIAEAEPRIVEGKTFYIGDAPLPSTAWLDAFALALTGKPVRRVPGWLLRGAAYAGEMSGRIGGPSPINLGRLKRMTTDFPVPIERTFAIFGRPRISLEEGVARTVNWLNRNNRA
jgi:nucleoside-diphosphate-sugar epimerase